MSTTAQTNGGPRPRGWGVGWRGVQRAWAGVLGGWAVLGSCWLGWAEETNAVTGLDYSAFGIIAERNIFNPSRSGRSPAPRVREARREPRVETFGLAGTMIYEKGYFAFFDGSSSEYAKVVTPGGTIGGHTVEEIASGGVRLKHGEKEIELKVNQQMRREDEGEWQVSDRSGGGRGGVSMAGGDRGRESERGRDRGSERGREWDRSRGSESRPAAGGSSSSSGELSDVLKRLMEQREREMK